MWYKKQHNHLMQQQKIKVYLDKLKLLGIWVPIKFMEELKSVQKHKFTIDVCKELRYIIWNPNLLFKCKI